MLAFLKLVRVGNLIIIALTQLFAYYFLAAESTFPVWSDLQLLLVVMSTMLVAGAGNIINDYMDVKLDMVNKPRKVVIGKSISRRTAIILHLIMNGIALVMAYSVSWKLLIIHTISAVILWLYSEYFKRQYLIGNLVIASLTALVLIVLWVYQPALYPAYVISYAIFAFIITLIREIIKDVEDMKGDRMFNCRTLPVVSGIRKTKQVLVAITVALMAFTFIFSFQIFGPQPHRNSGLVVIFYLYGLLFVLLPLGVMLYLFLKADTKKDFSVLSSFAKVVMVMGVLSMLFLKG